MDQMDNNPMFSERLDQDRLRELPGGYAYLRASHHTRPLASAFMEDLPMVESPWEIQPRIPLLVHARRTRPN